MTDIHTNLVKYQLRNHCKALEAVLKTLTTNINRLRTKYYTDMEFGQADEDDLNEVDALIEIWREHWQEFKKLTKILQDTTGRYYFKDGAWYCKGIEGAYYTPLRNNDDS